MSHHTLYQAHLFGARYRRAVSVLAVLVVGGVLGGAMSGCATEAPPKLEGTSTAAAPDRTVLPAIGASAPEIDLRTSEGAVFRLSDARGKAVVVNFWASWCGPCREEMPRFDRASRDLADRVVFVGVNATTLDSRAAALEFAAQIGVTFPLVFDEDGEVGRQYGVSALPATFFVDADGVLRAAALGPVLADRLRENLALVEVR